MSKKTKNARGVLLGVALLWAGGIIVGSYLMLQHEFNTGASYSAPSELPEALQGYRHADRPYLLVLSLHPECACTRATLEQIERLLAKNPDSIQIIALYSDFSSPDESVVSVGQSYRETLQSLPATTVLSDPDGTLASRLGAALSGSIAFYDEKNQLRFEGGITASRGHSGSSVGLSDLERIARALEPREICSTPVFGCSLEDPQS